MLITLDIPEDLAIRLNPLERKLPQILELGLREFNAGAQTGFVGTAEILEFLANLPSPEDIFALRPSDALQTQINTLLEKIALKGLREMKNNSGNSISI